MQTEGPSTSPKAESKDSGKKISHTQKKSSISEDKKITSIYSDEEGDDEDNDEVDEKEEEVEKEGGNSGYITPPSGAYFIFNGLKYKTG